MKRIFSFVLIIAVLIFMPSYASAEDNHFNDDWYFTKDYHFTIPLKEEFPGRNVQVTVTLGCIKDHASKGGYYFDRVVSYDAKIVSEDEEISVEYFNVATGFSGYRERVYLQVIGDVVKTMPLKYTVRPPKSGPLKWVSWSFDTDLYIREMFDQSFELVAR